MDSCIIDDLKIEYPMLTDDDKVCNCVDCGALLMTSRQYASFGLPMLVYDWIGIAGGRLAPICKPCMLRRCELAAIRLRQSRVLNDEEE